MSDFITREHRNDGLLTIEAAGSLDANSAPALMQTFNETWGDTDTELLLDMNALGYISSAGLRVLVSIQKKLGDKFKVINAAPAVYDVFTVTGIDDIIHVEKRLRDISVEGCPVIGQGATGTVYRIGPETIAKVYKPGVEPVDIREESARSKEAFKRGIPTAITFDIVKCGDCYATVFELINATTVAEAVNAAPEQVDFYASLLAKMVREAHAIDMSGVALPSCKDQWREWVQNLDAYYTKTEIDKAIAYVDAIPECPTFVHNDIHTKNVMLLDNECIMIDMGDICYGHPLFDLCGIFNAQVDSENNFFCGIDEPLRKPFWNRFIRDYFSTDDETYLGERLKEINFAHQFRLGFCLPTMVKGASQELIDSFIEKGKTRVLPYIDDMTGKVGF
ncbi:MAG: anti-sigma factor antagonist [Spirochaetaceae bacterium]|jgi:uncharacterized protein (TIGR02172 family)|nr:anti-sigma factor antagonist [Spirochaetaceae bacterium]